MRHEQAEPGFGPLPIDSSLRPDVANLKQQTRFQPHSDDVVRPSCERSSPISHNGLASPARLDEFGGGGPIVSGSHGLCISKKVDDLQRTPTTRRRCNSLALGLTRFVFGFAIVMTGGARAHAQSATKETHSCDDAIPLPRPLVPVEAKGQGTTSAQDAFLRRNRSLPLCVRGGGSRG